MDPRDLLRAVFEQQDRSWEQRLQGFSSQCLVSPTFGEAQGLAEFLLATPRAIVTIMPASETVMKQSWWKNAKAATSLLGRWEEGTGGLFVAFHAKAAAANWSSFLRPCPMETSVAVEAWRWSGVPQL
jgi:hypothetical protein